MTAATTSRPPLLVALDIDGTTIDHSGGLSPAVREAVTAVVAAGHHLVISTGRSIVATLPIVRLLGLERGYAVCSNGAVTLAFAAWTMVIGERLYRRSILNTGRRLGVREALKVEA